MTSYFLKRLLRRLKTPSKHKGGMPVAIDGGVEFDLTFSRLPTTIRSVYANLDRLLEGLNAGSSLPVTNFLPSILQSNPSDT